MLQLILILNHLVIILLLLIIKQITKGIIKTQMLHLLLSVLVIAFVLYRLKLYFSGKYYSGVAPKLETCTAIVTGGASGIGKAVVHSLADQGCKVIIADIIDASRTAQQINAKTSRKLASYVNIDLGDLDSIQMFANKIRSQQKIDILVCNAGIIGHKSIKMTKSNFEQHFGINYVGHFYLIYLLWSKLNRSKFFRIVNVSSKTHMRVNGFGKLVAFQPNNYNFEDGSYDRDMAYSRSKLYQAMLAKALSQQIQQNKGFAISVHPGIVRTDITKNMFSTTEKILMKLIYPIYWMVTKDCEQGAQTILHGLYSDPKDIKSGGYYSDCQLTKCSPLIDQHYKKLFESTQILLGIRFGEISIDKQQN